MKEILMNALKETYEVYGKEQLENAIIRLITEEKYDRFTKGQNIAMLVAAENLGEINIISEIYRNYVEKVLESGQSENILEQAIKETYYKYINSDEIKKICENELLSSEEYLISILINQLKNYFKTGKNNFTRDHGARAALNNAGYSKSDIINFLTEKVVEEVIRESDKTRGIINVKVYPRNLEALREKMITGLTHDVEGSIALSEMRATTDIGNQRTNQEDAVLLKVHPRNSEFKIMIVSDGMGGHEYGEKASHAVIQEINEWFDTLPEEYYYKDIRELVPILRTKIKQISVNINEKIGGGATLVGTIIGEKDTLVVNVGDSRAYTLKDNKLMQVTRDDSVVQDEYELGRIAKKDDMRFHRKSNYITQYIGERCVSPSFTVVSNKDYEKLLLFSDGVTDCLSDSQIYTITKNTPKELLSQVIVDVATKINSVPRPEIRGNKEYYSSIRGGKDNATAAVYGRE